MKIDLRADQPRSHDTPCRSGASHRSAVGLLGLLGVLGCLLGARPVLAQDVRVQVARGPYYVGESFEIQVIATDFEEEPRPEIVAGAHSGGTLRFVGISPSTSTSISIVNGKMTRVHEVSFVYRYQFTGTAVGTARIPEFSVEQGGVSRSTRGFDVDIVGVPSTDRVGIELDVPDGPIFVGQKIPISIELRIDRETQRDLISYQVNVPLFDAPILRFLDEPPPRTDTHLEIETAAGTLRLPATSSEVRRNGRESLVVRAERIMIAVATGGLRVEAPTVFINQGSAFRRDLFNQRRATATEKLMASGEPIRLEVADVPRQGRPESFAGAVGSGFSLEVEADRSVIQLGEPIVLSFHLRGDGDLSSASLPPLDAEGLLDPERFRIPKESPAGILDEDGKHFEVTVRVVDAAVREIPALAYAWFDAESRRFETTHSRPIALSVGAAEIIGADAVTRAEGLDEPARATSGDASVPGDTPTAQGDGVTRSSKLSLTGANLAIDRDLERLLRSESAQRFDLALTMPLYLTGFACLVLAAGLARRRAIDPRVVARTRAFTRARQAMEEAFSLSEGGAAALGRALRELLAAMPEEGDAELDTLIAECDALRFAPTAGRSDAGEGGGPGVPPVLRERARRLVEQRSKQIPRRREEA